MKVAGQAMRSAVAKLNWPHAFAKAMRRGLIAMQNRDFGCRFGRICRRKLAEGEIVAKGKLVDLRRFQHSRCHLGNRSPGGVFRPILLADTELTFEPILDSAINVA